MILAISASGAGTVIVLEFANTYQQVDYSMCDFGYMPRGTNGALRHGILYNAK